MGGKQAQKVAGRTKVAPPIADSCLLLQMPLKKHWLSAGQHRTEGGGHTSSGGARTAPLFTHNTGGICPVRYFSSNYPDFSPKFTLSWRSSPSRPRWAAHLSHATPAFLRVPNKGDKFKSGYITPAFLGAQNWAEMLHNHCILGGPQQRGQIQKWLHNPCLGKVDS